MSEETQTGEAQSKSLESKLKRVVENVYLLSETDAPIEIVTLSGTEDVKAFIGRETNTDAANITEIAFDEFLDMYGTVKDWQNDIQKDYAGKIGEALNLLKAGTENVKIFRAGSGVRANLYIIGQDSASAWIGMKTLVVET